jgi:dUTPase
MLNLPGTVAADNRDEVCIIKINISNRNLVIHDNDCISQMIIAKYKGDSWDVVNALGDSLRG